MLSFFPLDVLDEIWDVIESVSDGFLTYSSELFPETCQYNVFRKDRNLHGGGVMLIIHKDIRTCPCLNWKTTQNRFGQNICK